MPRSEEAEAWYAAVYQAVQEVPYGKVTSYGHIAALLGYPERPRQVGMCLKYLPSAADQPDSPYNDSTVPWQRVINSKGEISNRGANGAARQEAALAQEQVQVLRGSLGERTVDFDTYGWFPDELPSRVSTPTPVVLVPAAAAAASAGHLKRAVYQQRARHAHDPEDEDDVLGITLPTP